MNEVLDRLQDLAIRFKAKAWDEADLIDAIAQSPHVPEECDILRILKQANMGDVQRKLYQRDVGIWRGLDKRWRLIDQQPPDSQRQALVFMSTPTIGPACAFCRLADNPEELAKNGSRFVHPMCRRALSRWARAAMRRQRADAPHWSDVLKVDRRTADRKQIDRAYKRAAQKAHPDKKGGSTELMSTLNKARDEALASAQAR